MKRAVTYERFSSDLQNDRSIEDQRVGNVRISKRESCQLVGHYEDRGISGDSIVRRPGIQALLAAAARAQFDVVIVESTSRISRDQEDRAAIRKLLAFHDITLITLDDGVVTNLVDGIRAVVDSEKLNDLRREVRRGLAAVVRSGRHAGGRAYGYSLVPGKPGQLSINDAEAAVVRRIFTAYAGGATPRQIARDLNADGIASPRGTLWAANTINGNSTRGYGILRNALYAGQIVWNRVRMVKHPVSRRRLSRPNPKGQHQVMDAPQLRIVDQALFERVQTIKGKRAHLSPEHHRKPRRLLSGLLRCGRCGGGMAAVGRDKTGKQRMMCSRLSQSGTCSNHRRLYMADVEAETVNGLSARLRDRKFLSAYVKEYNAERRRLAGEASVERPRLERRADEIAAELSRGINSILKGIVDAETLREPIARLRAEQSTVAQRLAALGAAGAVVALHPEAISRYQADIDQLAETLSRTRGGELGEGSNALRRLVSQVVVHVEDGYAAPWHVEIKGRLDELLKMPAVSQSAMVWVNDGSGDSLPPITPTTFTFSFSTKRAA